jgi:hypothetical protein
MDNEDMQKVIEAMLSKRDKEGKKYPGPDGSVIRWKRQVEREIRDKKKHGWRLWTRLNEELRTPPEYIIVKETPSDDKDKDNKEKDKDKTHVYLIDVDTGATTPKKRIFKNNTAKAAQKLLTKAENMKGDNHSVVRNPRYLTKHQREELDIALWGALLKHIDEEKHDHMYVVTPSTWTSFGALENP